MRELFPFRLRGGCDLIQDDSLFVLTDEVRDVEGRRRQILHFGQVERRRQTDARGPGCLFIRRLVHYCRRARWSTVRQASGATMSGQRTSEEAGEDVESNVEESSEVVNGVVA